jgi:hypothetical protein
VELMPMREIDAIRQRSPTGNSDISPWKSDYDEMAKKTVVRRASKYWPLSAELASALAMEDEHDQVEGEVTKREGPKVRALNAQVDSSMLFENVQEAEDHDPNTGEVVDAVPAPLPPNPDMGPVDQIIALAVEAQDIKACDALITRLKQLPPDYPGRDDAFKAITDRQKQLRETK